MDPNLIPIFETNTQNEKKRVYELFHSLSNFLYLNIKPILQKPSEILYQEICKTVDELQKIKDAHKIESKINKIQTNQTTVSLNKKILLDKYEIKTKKFIHHNQTNSSGNEIHINKLKTPPLSALCNAKELEKHIKVLNTKLHIEPKSPYVKNNNSSFADNQKNGLKPFFLILFFLLNIFLKK